MTKTKTKAPATAALAAAGPAPAAGAERSGNAVAQATESYVYGITPSGAPVPKAKGIGGRRLRSVEASGVAAIVSDTKPPVRAGKDELKAHARVLERALQDGPVLPMRFGV